MDSSRNTPSMFPRSVAVGVLAVSIVLLSWAIVTQTGILPFSLASDSGSQPMLSGRQDSTANAEGLASYFQSERGQFALASSTTAGLSIYHESEQDTAEGLSSEAGLSIYRKSEQGTFSNIGVSSHEQGLAIYRDSERNPIQVEPAVTGWEIYRAGEQGR